MELVESGCGMWPAASVPVVEVGAAFQVEVEKKNVVDEPDDS